MEKMIANYHTHSRWCRHADGEISEYIEQAIKLGMEEIAMTEHMAHRTGFSWLEWEKLPEYNEELNGVVERYSDRIHVIKGFEAEYFPNQMEDYRMIQEKYGYPFFLLGQHDAWKTNGEPIMVFGKKTTQEIPYYADLVCRGLETGFFNVLAHPDVILIDLIGSWDKNCEKSFQQIFAMCEKMNVPVEINMNGYRGNRGYPDKNVFAIAKDYDLTYVINADAHNPKCLFDDAYEKAVKLTKELGIEAVKKLDAKYLRAKG